MYWRSNRVLRLTTDQYQIALGSILGDGSLTKQTSKGCNSALIISNSVKQKDYLEWKHSKLENLTMGNGIGWKMNYSSYSPNGTMMGMFRTRSLVELKPLRESCYTDDGLTIPKTVFDKVSWLALMVWYFDDGNLNNKLGCTIAAQAFDKPTITMMVECLKNNLDLTVEAKASQKGFLLYFKAPSRDRFFDMIRQWTDNIPSMGYKMLPPIEERGCKICSNSYLPTRKQLQYQAVCSPDCKAINTRQNATARTYRSKARRGVGPWSNGEKQVKTR